MRPAFSASADAGRSGWPTVRRSPSTRGPARRVRVGLRSTGRAGVPGSRRRHAATTPSRPMTQSTQPAIVTIGNFDGVHLGHQKLIRQVADRARALGLCSLAVTFEPHPEQVLFPERKLTHLSTPEERVRAAARERHGRRLGLSVHHRARAPGARGFHAHGEPSGSRSPSCGSAPTLRWAAAARARSRSWPRSAARCGWGIAHGAAVHARGPGREQHRHSNAARRRRRPRRRRPARPHVQRARRRCTADELDVDPLRALPKPMRLRSSGQSGRSEPTTPRVTVLSNTDARLRIRGRGSQSRRPRRHRLHPRAAERQCCSASCSFLCSSTIFCCSWAGTGS